MPLQTSAFHSQIADPHDHTKHYLREDLEGVDNDGIIVSPDVFAPLEPLIYLLRHIENGFRPSGAPPFEDFRPINAQLGNIKNTFGSALVGAFGAGDSTLLLKKICH
jgi:hypothetical protein